MGFRSIAQSQFSPQITVPDFDSEPPMAASSSSAVKNHKPLHNFPLQDLKWSINHTGSSTHRFRKPQKLRLLVDSDDSDESPVAVGGRKDGKSPPLPNRKGGKLGVSPVRVMESPGGDSDEYLVGGGGGKGVKSPPVPNRKGGKLGVSPVRVMESPGGDSDEYPVGGGGGKGVKSPPLPNRKGGKSGVSVRVPVMESADGDSERKKKKKSIRIRIKRKEVRGVVEEEEPVNDVDQNQNQKQEMEVGFDEDDDDNELIAKTWNFRPRRSMVGKASGVQKKISVAVPEEIKAVNDAKMAEKKEEEIEIEKEKEKEKEEQIEKGNEEKKKKKQKKKKSKKLRLSIPLTKMEIEEDIYALTGSKPSRKPKKRSKHVQRQLDCLFPGMWLSSITPDMYKVTDAPAKD